MIDSLGDLTLVVGNDWWWWGEWLKVFYQGLFILCCHVS